MRLPEQTLFGISQEYSSRSIQILATHGYSVEASRTSSPNTTECEGEGIVRNAKHEIKAKNFFNRAPDQPLPIISEPDLVVQHRKVDRPAQIVLGCF